ncbi:MAG TPA: hypothetical protein VHJ34_10325, partial [Actinomycetota bacterium]|nr:hypothetical protein [Actinomycetota bacterium]
GATLASAAARSLDLNPEMSNAALRGRVRMAATLTDSTGKAAPVNGDVLVYFEVDGPGDPKADGRTFDTPDLQCTVKAGDVLCRRSYANASKTAGTDTVWAWIAGTTVDETEGRNAKTEPGAQAERDSTDSVAATWFEGLQASASLDCDPETAIVAVGASRTYTCTVRDGGQLLNGWEIDAENLSPAVNDLDNSAAGRGNGADYDGSTGATGCVTGQSAEGQCRMTIPAEKPAQAGRALICFWVDEEGDGSFHPEGRVEWDGSFCDEGISAIENGNRTDVVALSWKYARSISLRSSKKVVERGRRVSLSGAITSAPACRGNKRVVIKRDVLHDGRPHKYSAFKATTTGALGRYSVRFRMWKSAKYQAVVVKSTKCRQATSLGRKVLLRT